jgi:hypothetical protein
MHPFFLPRISAETDAAEWRLNISYLAWIIPQPSLLVYSVMLNATLAMT